MFWQARISLVMTFLNYILKRISVFEVLAEKINNCNNRSHIVDGHIVNIYSETTINI